MQKLLQRITQGSLVKQIMVGLVAGILVALVSPAAAAAVGLLGTLFVGALKAVAPLLVLILVMASIANHKQGQKTNIRPILFLYLLGTFAAALVAVVVSFIFPSTLALTTGATDITPPGGIVDVMKGLLLSVVANPFHALINANYIGILAWAVGLGLALRHASDTTKGLINDMSHAVTLVVRAVIRCAPLGIFGLVASTLAETGFGVLWGYAQLLMVLLGCMLLVALVLNPLIVYWKIRRNPYPLVFACLRESGVTAFFTRSSAANIPVNMELCKKLNLNEDTYSVSIPLGATINMAGAAITITVLTLAAVNTLGIAVDVPTALLLSVVAALWRLRRGRRLAAADSAGVQHVRHSERRGDAGGSRRLYHRRAAGFGGNRPQLLHRRAVHRRGLPGGRPTAGERRPAEGALIPPCFIKKALFRAPFSSALQRYPAFKDRQLAEVVGFITRRAAVGDLDNQIDEAAEQGLHRHAVDQAAGVEIDPVRLLRRQLAVGGQLHRRHKAAVRRTSPGAEQHHMAAGTGQRAGRHRIVARRAEQIQPRHTQPLTVFQHVYHLA